MIVQDRCSTTAPQHALKTRRRMLGQYANHHHHFTIGATTDPRRCAEDSTAEGWSRMVLLYLTRSSRFAIEVEEGLVDHGEAHYACQFTGIHHADEPLDPAFQYYVYVLLD